MKVKPEPDMQPLAAEARSGKFRVGKGHKPFVVLQEGGKFSCANCVYLGTRGSYQTCGSPDYQAWAGIDVLIDPDTGTPLTEEQLESACSDWFREK